MSESDRYAERSARKGVGKDGAKGRLARIDEEAPQEKAGIHRATSQGTRKRSQSPKGRAAVSSATSSTGSKMKPSVVSREPAYATKKKASRQQAAEQSEDGVLGAKFMYDAQNAGRHNIRSPGDDGTYDAGYEDGLHKFEGDVGQKRSVAISHKRRFGNEEDEDAALEAARGQMPDRAGHAPRERPNGMQMGQREVNRSPSVSPGDGRRDAGMHRQKSQSVSRQDTTGKGPLMYRQSVPTAYILPNEKARVRREEDEEHEAQYGESGRYAGIDRDYGGWKDGEFPDDRQDVEYTAHQQDDIRFHDGDHQAADEDAEANSSRLPLVDETDVQDILLIEPLASHRNAPLPSYRLDEEGREIVEIEDSGEMETYLDDEILRISREIEELSAEERSYAFDPKAYM